jgi:uncharacterized membrane protein YgcG
MKILLILILSLISITTFAKEIPPLSKTINDYTQSISQEDQNKIDTEIRDYFKKSTNQIGVLLVNTLDDETLSSYATKVFEKWKLGDLKKDNGVLLLYSIQDRKLRIEVGQGLEGDLTDVESKRIISSLTPLLKSKQYGAAILKEIDSIKNTIEKNQARARQPKPDPRLLEQQRILAHQESLRQVEILKTTILGFSIAFLIGIFAWQCFYTHELKFRNEQKYQGNKDKKVKVEKLMTLKKENQVKLEVVRKKNQELEGKFRGSDHAKNENLSQQCNEMSIQLSAQEDKIQYLKDKAKKYGVNV